MKMMNKYLWCLGLAIFPVFLLKAQVPAQKNTPTSTHSGRHQDPKNGHLTGKVVDAATGKGIGGASVELFVRRMDSASNTTKETLVTTVPTQNNGDFELNNLPVFGSLRLAVIALSYTQASQDVSFTGGNGNAAQGGMAAPDKDLGTIQLVPNSADLNAVVVTATKPYFQMGVDRKVFNVDKDIVSTGQTAQEVLKQIPSLNVDIDGNVTMRNATPTIFVDGRPTTLTMDQIPSDLIESVELITNPSAKFDASGGGGGILNIVLKKNRKVGYNGGLSAGIDTRGGANIGGDINLRQGKFNLFARGSYRGRNGKGTNYSDRDNLNGVTIEQNGTSKRNGNFTFLNLGSDYYLDNKNTFTVSGTYVNGGNDNKQPQTIDSLLNGTPYSFSRIDPSLSHFNFKNYGADLNYVHSFAKKGHELTSYFNYNGSNNTNTSSTLTNVYNDAAFVSEKRPGILYNSNGTGSNKYFTGQVDYSNPLTDNSKLEAGARAAIRDFSSNSFQYTDSTGVGESALIFRNSLSSKYKFNDQVYAGYVTYSSKIGENLSYQLGVRAESSNYTGHNTLMNTLGSDSATSDFKVNYAINLFPSLFVTYNLPERQDIQFNYSRKVNRPSFFQLLPTPDVSDPQNIRVGNPDLKPEFTSNYELSYDKSYGNGGNFLATAYMRYTTNLITGYQYQDSIFRESTVSIVNTYINANHSYTYGLELTNKITLASIWDLMLNFNLFNSKIEGGSDATDISNQRWSWLAKMNNTFKLPSSFSVQLSGSYQAKTVLPNSSGSGFGGGGRGGGGFGFGNVGTAQGYIKPRYGVDVAIKKDWRLKSGNSASITLSMNDIFRTNYNKAYSETQFMIQNTSRLMNPQMARLTFSWRFGKMDSNLFKKKKAGNDMDNGGGDMMDTNG